MDNVSYKPKDMKGSSTLTTMIERAGHDMISAPDPEVPELKPRRNFTAKYKLRILDEADRCSQPGELGAMLRREGLYSSNLTTWRRQKEKGLLQVMSPKKRGRKHKEKNPLASRVAQLEKENRRLEQKLKQAELIIEAQKKMSEILGIAQNLSESNENK
jgi:transposase-like protein